MHNCVLPPRNEAFLPVKMRSLFLIAEDAQCENPPRDELVKVQPCVGPVSRDPYVTQFSINVFPPWHKKNILASFADNRIQKQLFRKSQLSQVLFLSQTHICMTSSKPSEPKTGNWIVTTRNCLWRLRETTFGQVFFRKFVSQTWAELNCCSCNLPLI